MRLASVRIITDDVPRLVGFYELVTGATASWANPDFAELTTDTIVLAIGSTRTVGLFGPGSAHAADNHSLIVEFLVDDVDQELERLRTVTPSLTFVNEPADLPWGNRSLLLRDPDGTLVNLFTPITEAARAKWLS